MVGLEVPVVLEVLCPLRELAEGHKGDQRPAVDQSGGQRPNELALVDQRGNVGVENDRLHVGSGDVAVALGVDVAKVR
jgi:hypothetical protein